MGTPACTTRLKRAEASCPFGTPLTAVGQQWQALLAILHQEAQAAGFLTHRWTLLRVQQRVRECFGVRFSTAYLSVPLRELGWSVQPPQPSPRAREDACVQAWLKGDWPRIKKRLTTGTGRTQEGNPISKS